MPEITIHNDNTGVAPRLPYHRADGTPIVKRGRPKKVQVKEVLKPEDYQFLDVRFIKAMNNIGRYGAEKYGADSFYEQAARGEVKRVEPRQSPSDIIAHATAHLNEYYNGILHDHFNTRGAQLAAAAFNAQMEYFFLLAEVA